MPIRAQRSEADVRGRSGAAVTGGAVAGCGGDGQGRDVLFRVGAARHWDA